MKPTTDLERAMERTILELTDKIQYLVDTYPTKLEDGGITFPDGDFWRASSKSTETQT